MRAAALTVVAAAVVVLALVAATTPAGVHAQPFPNVDWYPCPLFTSLTANSHAPGAERQSAQAAQPKSAEARAAAAAAADAAEQRAQQQRLVDDALESLGQRRGGRPHLGLERTAHVPGDDLRSAALQMAWCALFDVPLYHTEPNAAHGNRTIQVFVKKLNGGNSTARSPDPNRQTPKSIIFFQGGPGGSSEALEHVMYVFNRFQTEPVDTYTMDHRGVGRSTRLGCTRSQAETPGSLGGTSIVDVELALCGQELRNYTHGNYAAFTPDNAAGDIHSVLSVMWNTDWYVYGVSYGTMLVQRYLDLYPTQPKAVILDGVVTLAGGPGRRLTFDYWDVGQTETAATYFATYCAADVFCSSKLGADPWQTAMQVMDSVWPQDGSAGTHCPAVVAAGLDRDTMKAILGGTIVSLQLRHLVAASIYRLRRCSDNDVLFFNGFGALFGGAASNCPVGLDSDMVHSLIGGAELYDARRPYSELVAQTRVQYVSSASSVLDMWDLVYRWNFPRYTPNPATFNRTVPGVGKPVLLFNGDLDAQTPVKYAAYTAGDLQTVGAAHTTLVTVAGAPHGTILYSASAGDAVPCTARIIMSFMGNNAQAVNQDCLNRLLPVNFAGNPALNLQLFGTGDVYDGVAFAGAGGAAGDDTVKRSTFVATVVPLAVVAAVCLVTTLWYCARAQRSQEAVGLGQQNAPHYSAQP